jgi:hypothetical protein
VHPDAIRAAVDLRGAHLDEMQQFAIDVPSDHPLELDEMAIGIRRHPGEVHSHLLDHRVLPLALLIRAAICGRLGRT